MKAKTILSVISCLLILSFLMSVFEPQRKPALASPTTEKKIVLKAIHAYPVTHARQWVFETMNKMIGDATNGRVKIRIFGAGSLFSAREEIGALIDGSADMSLTPTPYLIKYPVTKPLNILMTIGSMPTLEALCEVEDLIMKEGWDEKWLKPLGIKSLGLLPYTNGGIVASSSPIRTLDDIRGKRLRWPVPGFTRDYWGALGCILVTVSAAEMVSAVQTGVIDGIITSLEAGVTTKSYQVAPYVMRIRGLATDAPVAFSMKTWKKLPKDVQVAFEGMMPKLIQMSRDRLRKETKHFDETLRKESKEYMMWPEEIEKEAFRLWRPLWKKHAQLLKVPDEVFNKIMEINKKYQ